MKTLLPAILILCIFNLAIPNTSDAIPKCRPKCTSCNPNISGDWNYTLLVGNIPKVGFPKTVTLTRQKKSFTGVNDSHTFVGSMRGKWLNFTMVVTGEETEGHVRKIDGTFDGDRIVGVYLDSNGEIGSFIATPA